MHPAGAWFYKPYELSTQPPLRINTKSKMNDLNFSKCKVLIVGDIMLDKYYFGNVERISPEAPVPVVNIKKEESRLGGAANVANNIASLGGEAMLCGIIGHDLFGKEIERLARRSNIGLSLLATTQPTITKARIIGGKQQIARLDYEEKLELSDLERFDTKRRICQLLPDYQILVISDYGKGFISHEFCQFLIEEAHHLLIPTIVDPKGKDWSKYTGANMVTPNVKELSDIVGYNVPNSDDAITQAATEAIRANNLTSLLVTRSEKGISLIGNDSPVHLPTHSEEVFDVSGAGDTVVAMFSLCLAAGYDLQRAMKMANIAAGVVVKKIGTATLTVDELAASMR